MNNGINVISTFDGISCGRMALLRAGIPVNKYYAFEIDKFAIQTSLNNWSDVIHLGDIKGWEFFDQLPKIDLMLGGFPCQSHSIAGNRKGLDDPRGQLFYVMVDFFTREREKNPDIKFLFENVTKIKKDDLKIINELLGVEPVKVNSALVSAQNRERLYWTNIPGFVMPEDRGIVLKDILETGGIPSTKNLGIYTPRDGKSTCLDASYYKGVDNHGQRTVIGMASDINGHDFLKRIYSVDGKSPTLTANSGGNQERKIAVDSLHYRKLTPIECERLQTLTDNYTAGVSSTQRYKQIGNGWTVDVIVEFLKNLKEK